MYSGQILRVELNPAVSQFAKFRLRFTFGVMKHPTKKGHLISQMPFLHNGSCLVAFFNSRRGREALPEHPSSSLVCLQSLPQ
jgi:hypothetical protein